MTRSMCPFDGSVRDLSSFVEELIELSCDCLSVSILFLNWLILELFSLSPFCRFTDYVNETITHLRPTHCTRERKVDVEFDMTTVPAFLVVLIVLWLVLKPRRPKPKIN